MPEQTESNKFVRRLKWLRKFTVLLILALVLLTAIMLLFLIRFYRPYGKGPAGPVVDRSAFMEIWTDRPVVLLGLGDSITAGFGVAENRSYFARLIENPPDEFPSMKGICLKTVLPNLTALNKAVSGSNSLDHLRLLESQEIPCFSEKEFGLVVLTTGGNDLIHFYGKTVPCEGAMYGASKEEAKPWIAHFRKRLDLIIEKINAHFPGGCLIFLADIYDPTDGVGDGESIFLPAWSDGTVILAQYNQCIKDCAQTHSNVFLVPLYEGFSGHGVHCREDWREHYSPSDPTCWFGVNIEDPNSRGYDAARRIFLNEIIKQRCRFKK